MFKQSISIVEFPKLYNILQEIKKLFIFKIDNYLQPEDFIREINKNNTDCLNSIVILNKDNPILLNHTKVNKNNIIILNSLPIKINSFIDKINIQIIKQKYNFQSNLNIKNYTLDFNSRTISFKKKELRLTEREIDIILFLNENKEAQSVNKLQSKVWGHAFNLETHTVETHIYRLRKKIKDEFDDENFIVSSENGYLI